MSANDRLPVFPSEGAQLVLKNQLMAAQRGHGLLKKKAEALEMRFRVILGKIIETKNALVQVLKEATFALAETKFVAGDFNQIVLGSVGSAAIKVYTTRDNVAGVMLPVFECYDDGRDSYGLLGLAKGGQQMQKLKQNYRSAISLLVDLASEQTSFLWHTNLRIQPPSTLAQSGPHVANDDAKLAASRCAIFSAKLNI
ncbi:vacuolar ATP synthase subunit D [Culex quinquefasciatus]|uniref:Vacuolar ATP synthase subunit D n=1 Tax=Culex quinquefasciatus TaxID=7176 RepID=B0WRD0_CULQU|nr:vacuolar ATP synthase subunit D [Culex quinquefasciatus]|eukprot:XP_001851264.1 vacuolar ATP synthase subunit D [Culex quinquefasciatus]